MRVIAFIGHPPASELMSDNEDECQINIWSGRLNKNPNVPGKLDPKVIPSWRKEAATQRFIIETLKIDGTITHLLHGPIITLNELYHKKEMLLKERIRNQDVSGFPRYLLVKVEEEIL